MNERLNNLMRVIEELKGDAYSEQYGIADDVDSNVNASKQMDQLCSETEFYRRILNEIKTLQP